MTRIVVVFCPYCDGPESVARTNVTMHHRGDNDFVYAFTCSERKIRVFRSAGGGIMRRLEGVGIKPTRLSVPKEVTEPHTSDIMIEQDADDLARLLDDDRHMSDVMAAWTAQVLRQARQNHPTDRKEAL